MISRRYKRQRFKRKRGIFFRLILISIILALICAGLYAFYRYMRDSENFTIKAVRVSGHEVLTEDYIVASSGLSSNDNVFFFDSRAVVEKVKAIPYVKTCRIRRGFPDFVAIEVEERKPLATLMVGSRCFEFDADGIVLSEIPLNKDPVGPLITNVPELRSVTPGEDVSKTAAMKGLDVWQAFSRMPISSEITISEISVSEISNIRMYCNEFTYEIRWGRGNFDSQAQKLDILWREKQGEIDCEEYLDLRFDEFELICK